MGEQQEYGPYIQLANQALQVQKKVSQITDEDWSILVFEDIGVWQFEVFSKRTPNLKITPIFKLSDSSGVKYDDLQYQLSFIEYPYISIVLNGPSVEDLIRAFLKIRQDILSTYSNTLKYVS